MKSKYFNALLLVFVLTGMFTVACTAQTSKEKNQTIVQNPNVQTIKIKVGGITCSGDCKDIQKVVSKMNGVASCKQIGKPASTSVFEVSFNPSVVSEKDIRKVVEDTPSCDNPNEKTYKVKQG